MHIPKESIKSTAPHEIIALIGAPGSGKTTSCLSFPNRVWYDFDHKLPANETSIPLWDAAFCDKLAKRTHSNSPANRRDAFRKHFRENHALFTEDQTVIVDSWTLKENAFDQQTQIEEDMADKPNPFSFWKRKGQYGVELMEMAKACRARVVFTFHEAMDRDAEGELTGKLRPVMDGSFKDQLLGHFTDVWRQLCNPYERNEKGSIVIAEGKKVVKTGWWWQLLGDEQVNTNTNPILGVKLRAAKIKMVAADYNEILKIYTS